MRENLSPSEKMAQEIERKRENHRDKVQREIWMSSRRNSNNLTAEEVNELDEDYRMQQYAKAELMDSESNKELLMKADLLIEENWLGSVEALPGNLFCLGAFGDIWPEEVPFASEESLKGLSKYIGCGLIVLIQLMGPPLIFFSKMPGNIGVLNDQRYEWRCFPLSFNPYYDEYSMEECPGGMPANEVSLFQDWYHIKTTRMLGTVFIIAFILNAIFVIMEEMNTWSRVFNTFRFLDKMTEKFRMTGRGALYSGAVVNCWVVMWSCANMYAIVGASMTPQDLLMDALGLLFLYNLDDIGGDLGFVDEDDWPALRIAWIYENLVANWPDEDTLDDQGNVVSPGFDQNRLDWMGFITMLLYKLVLVLLVVMAVGIPILAAITPFTQIAPE